MREALDDLPDVLPILIDIHAANPAVTFALFHVPLDLPALEALVVDEAIARREPAHKAADATYAPLDTANGLAVSSAKQDPAHSEDPAAPPLLEFRFTEGASNKFWKVGVADGDYWR